MPVDISEFLYWEKRGETYKDLDDVKNKRTAYKIVSEIKSLGIDEDSWILDAGCGRGDITKIVRDNFRHAGVIGIDLSRNMIKGAKLKETSRLKFLQSDFFEFISPFESFFNLVTMNLFLHHLVDGKDKLALYKINKSLISGGWILISEALPPSDYIFDYYSQIFSLKENRNCYLLQDLLKMLRGAGFVDLKFKTYRFTIALNSWLNDKTLSNEKRNLIYSMHTEASKEFKEAYRMKEILGGDYSLSCKMGIVMGRKE